MGRGRKPSAVVRKDQPLTERQRAILSFVFIYIQSHGHPPAVRDIGKGVGLTSTSNVNYHLDRLVQGGYLGKGQGKGRTLVLLEAGYRQLGKPTIQDLYAEIATLQIENRRLWDWYRQFQGERGWELRLGNETKSA